MQIYGGNGEGFPKSVILVCVWTNLSINAAVMGEPIEKTVAVCAPQELSFLCRFVRKAAPYQLLRAARAFFRISDKKFEILSDLFPKINDFGFKFLQIWRAKNGVILSGGFGKVGGHCISEPPDRKCHFSLSNNALSEFEFRNCWGRLSRRVATADFRASQKGWARQSS